MGNLLQINDSWPVKGSLSWQMLNFGKSGDIKPRKKADPGTKILHLLSQQPGKTGSGVYLQELVKQGAKDNLKQRIIIGVPSDATHPVIAPLESPDIKPVKFCDPDLPFPVAGMSDVMPYHSTRFSEFSGHMLDAYLYAFANIINREVRRFNPDIIHTHHLWLATALARTLYPAIPVVTTCHGTELRQLDLVPALRDFVVPACSQIDRVMALHQNHMDKIQVAYGIDASKISLVGAGYRDDIFCSPQTGTCRRDQKDTLTVVYAGKLSFAKGLPWLIETADRLEHPSGKKIRLRIAGSGSGEEAKMIYEKALQFQDIIEFLGPKPQEELAGIFKDADIFVLPSFYEGLPLVVLEALACSCRIVVTELPGIGCWLPEELVRAGIVELVPLPNLIGPDVPHPSGLPLFMHNLVTSINKQLIRCTTCEPDWNKEVVPFIESMNWQGIYSKVKQVYETVLEKQS
jgi:glycosyltransferase involved in cell wall biosynthesis